MNESTRCHCHLCVDTSNVSARRSRFVPGIRSYNWYSASASVADTTWKKTADMKLIHIILLDQELISYR